MPSSDIQGLALDSIVEERNRHDGVAHDTHDECHNVLSLDTVIHHLYFYTHTCEKKLNQHCKKQYASPTLPESYFITRNLT